MNTYAHAKMVGGMALCAALLLVGAQGAYALEIPTGAFIVRPAKVELAGNPGGDVGTLITLQNGTAFPLRVTLSFEDIAATTQTSPSDDPVKLLGSARGAYPLKDFLTTPTHSFTILSGKELHVPVDVHIPKGTEPGGRYGSAVFTFTPILEGRSAEDANVAVESRVATLLYLRVLGVAKEEGHLVAFRLFNNARVAPPPSASLPLQFQVAYENTGTVHLNTYGRLTLTPLIGAPHVYALDPLAVLPAETRMREVAVRETLPIGYYMAHLELNRGYGDVVDEQTIHFWIIPGTGGSILIILGLVALGWIIRRSLALSKHFVRS